MEVHTNWQRAVLVFGLLLEGLKGKKKRAPYHKRNVPQNLIPFPIWENKRILACFLFYCCLYMRGTIRSDVAIKRLASLWTLRPDLFVPALAAKLPLSEVTNLLAMTLGYRSEQIARFWIENSKILVRLWDGDPVAIFRGVKTYEELLARIANKKYTHATRGQEWTEDEQGFFGFQEKMASMLYYFLLDAGLIEVFAASPPADFHLNRIGRSTGIIVVVGKNGSSDARYEQIKLHMIAVLNRYIKEFGVNAKDLGDALWLLSRDLCAEQPGNFSRASWRKVIRKDGKLDAKPDRIITKVDWSVHRNVVKYQRSCGVCALEKYCTKNIPSGPYYNQGKFIERERTSPPEGTTVLYPADPYPPEPILHRPKRATAIMLRQKAAQTDHGLGRLTKEQLAEVRRKKRLRKIGIAA